MISTKGRYALRVMIDLAEHDQGQPVPLKDIAERQGISKKYLEIIVKELVDGKLVKGASGKGGGYVLLRKPEEYSIGEIVELMEGTLAPVACLQKDAEECPRYASCVTLPLWQELDQLVHDFLYRKKLSELVLDLFERFGELHTAEYDWPLTQESRDEIFRTVMTDKKLPDLGRKVEKISWLDGCKVYLDGGWVIVRFSGTEPRVRIFAEAESEQAAKVLVGIMARHVGLPWES